jgi:hypothetical protein
MSHESASLDPSRRALLGEAAVLLSLALALGAMARWRPAGLVAAGILLLGLRLAGRAGGGDPDAEPAGVRALLPLLMVAAGVTVLAGAPRLAAAAVIWAAGALATVIVALDPELGRLLHAANRRSAAATGREVSTVLLTAVFFLVFLPAGLILRLAGHDSMRRRFEPQARSYWTRQPALVDPARSFRQF